MPVRIRELKAKLRKAGFSYRPGKGDHTVWWYPADPRVVVVLSGNDGDDAKPYQEKEVRKKIKMTEKKP
jgi:hypothetical protein